MAWLSGWGQRVKLTLDNTDVTAALGNFPILVYLSTNSGRNNDDVSFVFDELTNNANRKKIAVTTSNGTTECYVEIERWDDANEHAWLWVKVPSISDSVDTDLYLYYDSSHAENTTYVDDTNVGNSHNVWDANFKAVYHMDDATTSTILDSTNNSNDGTKTAANRPLVAAGKIGNAQHFNDGTSDKIDCGAAASVKITGDLTLEAWVAIDNNPATRHTIISRYETTNNDRSYAMEISANKTHFLYCSEDGTWTVGNRTEAADPNFEVDGTWHHTASTYKLSTEVGEVFKDGSNVTETQTTEATGLNAGSEPLLLGAGRAGGAATRFMDGFIDEARVSNTVRSDSWIQTTYESGRDDLLDFGSEETAPSAAPLGNINLRAQSLGII